MSHPTIYSQYLSLVSTSLPSPPYPVITTGVCGFMFLTYIASIFNPSLLETWSFSINTIIVDYNTQVLNTFPLIHASFLHLFFNICILYPTLSEFEVSHGSLHTALVLNTLGAVTCIAYTITVCIFKYLGLADETALNVHLLGSSGWAFTFLTVHSCYKSINSSTTNIYNSYNIPTIFIPLFYLVISAILVPGSSFLGHLISIILGFSIYLNIFSKLTIPPFQILDKIENINLFKTAIETIFSSDYFVWTYEIEVKNSRYQECGFTSISLPIHHENTSTASNGDKLGSDL